MQHVLITTVLQFDFTAIRIGNMKSDEQYLTGGNENEAENQNEKSNKADEEDTEAKSSSCWSRYFPDGYCKELKEVLKLGAPMVGDS